MQIFALLVPGNNWTSARLCQSYQYKIHVYWLNKETAFWTALLDHFSNRFVLKTSYIKIAPTTMKL